MVPSDKGKDQDTAELLSLKEAERILQGVPGQEALLAHTRKSILSLGKSCKKKGGPTREVRLQSLLQRKINLQNKRDQHLEQQEGLQLQMDKINEDLDKVETELEGVKEELRGEGVDMESDVEDWEEPEEEEQKEVDAEESEDMAVEGGEQEEQATAESKGKKKKNRQKKRKQKAP